MNTNQDSPGINSWWHSDSPAYNWSPKVELEFDIKQKSTVCTFSNGLGSTFEWWMGDRGKSEMLVISEATCLPKFLWETEVFTDMWPSQDNFRGQPCGNCNIQKVNIPWYLFEYATFTQNVPNHRALKCSLSVIDAFPIKRKLILTMQGICILCVLL